MEKKLRISKSRAHGARKWRAISLTRSKLIRIVWFPYQLAITCQRRRRWNRRAREEKRCTLFTNFHVLLSVVPINNRARQQQNIGNDLSRPFRFSIYFLFIYCFYFFTSRRCLITVERQQGEKIAFWSNFGGTEKTVRMQHDNFKTWCCSPSAARTRNTKWSRGFLCRRSWHIQTAGGKSQRRIRLTHRRSLTSKSFYDAERNYSPHCTLRG